MHILFIFAVCTNAYYRLVLIWIGYIVTLLLHTEEGTRRNTSVQK